LIRVVERSTGSIVYLAGGLNESHAPQLRAVCQRASERGAVRIDLSDLLPANAVGIDTLRRLRGDGAELTAVPRYLRCWLA
jgi:hypothetical protein